MDYKEKYLKYKKKYLQLKQIAGANAPKQGPQGPQQGPQNRPHRHGIHPHDDNHGQQQGMEHHHHGHIHGNLHRIVREAVDGALGRGPKVGAAPKMREGVLVGGAYSEESNGYKSEEIDGKKYPPCFKYSGPSRNMHDELKSLGLLEKYQELMDVHSVLLCVEMDVRDNGKDCIASIRPRLDKLKAKPTSTPNNIVKEIFTNMRRDKMLEFMTKNKLVSFF